MILIIAEKPSLARNIVAGIGDSMSKRNGYYEGNGYLVTWAFGHLFSLCDVEDYTQGGVPADADAGADATANAAAQAGEAGNKTSEAVPGAAESAEATGVAADPSAGMAADPSAGMAADPSAGMAADPSAGMVSGSSAGMGRRFWSMDGLPCFPSRFRFKLKREPGGGIDAGVRKQFETIRSLCRRQDVDTIVNAGDADREGEIIVRLCVEHALGGAGNKKLMRLWLPDQTPETVKNALAALKPEREYDNLANEGFARTYIDWLYGVNLTRFATLKAGRLLRVGRVIVPVVRAVYDRDKSIRDFVPEVYYVAASAEETNGEKIELTGKTRFTKSELAQAEALCAKYNETGAYVKSRRVKKETVNPGKLYSLTKLQNVLGKKYKMPMEKSLATAQKLYEDGFLTYPRTNSEYLAVAEKDRIRKILESARALGYPVKFREDKGVFDDSKIESHSAITPTCKIPDKAKLTEDEYRVYSTVMRRFAAVFCEKPCRAEKTELTVAVGDLEEFVLRGTVLTEPGWTRYDDYAQKDRRLPKLQEGDPVCIRFAPAEKESTPPKHYTIETLNNYLKNPFREEKSGAGKGGKGKEAPGPAPAENADGAAGETDDAEEYRAIFEGLELGTEATRTGIINNAIKSGYISLKKDVYTILPGGEFLIESLERMDISMDKYKTSQLGRALKKVYRGTLSVEESVEIAKEEIAEVFRKREVRPELDRDIGVVGQIVGKCPYCGADFVRTTFGYGCRGYQNGCKFTVNSLICGRAISVSNMKLALETGRTSKIEGFISKAGKPFSAAMKLENGRLVFDFS